MNFRFDQPLALLLLLLALPIIWMGWRSLAQLDLTRRYTTIVLRLGVLLILVLMLAGLQGQRIHRDLTVIALIDQSQSVRELVRPPAAPNADPNAPRPQLQQWTRQWLIDASGDRRPDDRFGLITFDRRPLVRAMPGHTVSVDPGSVEAPQPGTDIAAAIRTGMALPHDSGARLVLISDGNQPQYDDDDSRGSRAGVLAAARQAAAAGIPIDVLPLEYAIDSEVMVQALHAPTEARQGQTAGLRVVLRATRPVPGTIQLLHDEQPVDLMPPDEDGRAQDLRVQRQHWAIQSESDEPSPHGRYVAVVPIDVPLTHAGPNQFQAIFTPDNPDDDTIAANNRATTFTMVAGRGSVLFVDALGGDSGAILPRTLQSRGIELDVISPRALPTRLSQLQRYDAVVFQNVSAIEVTGPQQRMISRYVNDLGGGFLMLGGPNSFGAGSWAHTPIDRILPVDSELPSQAVLPSGALVLVIDRSGSMGASVGGAQTSRQEVANEAAVMAMQSLYPQDLVGVVAFDTRARWIVDLQPVADPSGIARQIRSIQPGGGTHIYPGMREAQKALAGLGPQDAAIRHVIVLTDGMDGPSQSDYIGVVGDLMRSGATVSTVGVGGPGSVDVNLLTRIANMGGGTFYHVDDPGDLPQIIRKNLLKEVPFEPRHHAGGSPIVAGLGRMPQLQGLVLTGEKHDSRVFMPLTGPEDEPLFAHWQVGLGRSAAFTSDATNRWAVQWLDWGGYADFWTRTIRTISRPSQSRSADIVADMRGDRLHVRLDAASLDETGRGTAFANFLDVRGSVILPDNTTQTIRLQQTGPGIYEMSMPAQATGNYIVNLILEDPDGQRHAIFGGATLLEGQELRQFEADRALLEQIAQITGGRVLDAASTTPATLFERTHDFQSRSVRPLWTLLLPWLIALIILDVAARRIAWDAPAIYKWCRVQLAATADLIKLRQVQGGQTMAALKQRQAQTQQQITQEARQPARPASPPPDAPSRKRKFEADPGATAREDFASAVGGATHAQNKQPHASQAAAKTPEQTLTTAERLRAARLRAKQKIDDPQDND